MKWYNNLKIGKRMLLGDLILTGGAFLTGILIMFDCGSKGNTYAISDITISSSILIMICAFLVISIAVFIPKSITKPMKKLESYAQRLVEGDVNIVIENESKDEVGQIMAAFRELIEGIKGYANAAQKISNGDLTVNIKSKSSKDILALSMIAVVETLKNLELETSMLTKAAIEGNLSTRGDLDKFKGGYKNIVDGVNKTLDAVVEPINFASDYIQKLAGGQGEEITINNYKGSYGVLVDNISKVRNSLHTMLSESGKLSQAGLNGQLLVRGDVSNLTGGFANIIKGMNDTLDSITIPLNEAKHVMNKLSVNDFTIKMIGTYKGEMKDFAENINEVYERLVSIQDIFIKLAKGDIGRFEELKGVGKRSDNDIILPSVLANFSIIQELINASSHFAEASINGHLDVRSDTSKFEGGYKEIVSGFNKTLDAIENPINEAIEVLKKMKDGDLCMSMIGNYQGDYQVIKDAINHTLETFNELLGNIVNTSYQVSAGSDQVSDGSQALSQGTTEQASAIEELTSSITQVAAQTKQNAVNASQANELALNAKDGAILGNTRMKEMLKSMEEINESSTNISKIIKVIDDIAFQTNMLALNAAVEAARAGQHGKGFAVVAEEVRNLAARSAMAAKETADLVEGSIKKVELGTKIANSTAESLDQIVAGVSKAATLVGEIASASNEQATAISQIDKGIEQVSDVVQTNSATAEQSAAASEELSSQALMLKGMVEKFKLKKSTFVAESVVPIIHAKAPAVKKKPIISLSNNNFGKY